METRILAAVVTHEGHAYCQEACLFRLTRQTQPVEIMVFDTSHTTKNSDHLRDKGFKVVPMDWLPTAMQRIVQAKNKAIDLALEGGYDYLFFVDADLIIPVWSAARLLAHNKDAVGWIMPVGKGKFTFPGAYRSANITVGNYSLVRDVYDWVEVYARKGELVKMFGCNFGLLSRALISKVRFADEDAQRFLGFPAIGEDLRFWNDCREAGFDFYCDFGLFVEHLSQEWEGVYWTSEAWESQIPQTPK